MIERRCFVQLIHPGGEHEPDHGMMKQWNRGDHSRKFLKAPGRYRPFLDTADQEDEIVFWGEWEPESRVVARYASPRSPEVVVRQRLNAEGPRASW